MLLDELLTPLDGLITPSDTLLTRDARTTPIAYRLVKTLIYTKVKVTCYFYKLITQKLQSRNVLNFFNTHSSPCFLSFRYSILRLKQKLFSHQLNNFVLWCCLLSTNIFYMIPLDFLQKYLKEKASIIIGPKT